MNFLIMFKTQEKYCAKPRTFYGLEKEEELKVIADVINVICKV